MFNIIVKITKKHCLLLIGGIALILATVGCVGQKTESAESLMVIVKRQHVKVNGPKPDAWEFAEFSIDIPVEGPQPLLDSIKVFLNKELYQAFESIDLDENPPLFTFKDVYTDDVDHLLDSYVVNYSDHLKNVEWIWPSSFSFFMVAQTDSFVTYGVETGQGRGSVMFCHTFSKKDGHEIGEIITKEDLLRFLKDHPDVKHPFFDVVINDENDNQQMFFDLALLEDGVLCINEDWQNYYLASKFEYEELLSYLSTEAQELVNAIGETKYSYEDWSLGEEIGSVKTDNGETIFLMQRPPLWEGFDFFSSENEDFYQDKTYTLTAYTVKGGHYVMNEMMFPTPRLEFVFPEVAWVGLHFEDKDYFRFDPTTNLLLAPFRKTPTLVDFIPFRFDGQHFVKIDDVAERLFE